ncbi:MAG: hypothetical protein WCK10_02580 [Candidatus Staskawiczbacteria bacterium]
MSETEKREPEEQLRKYEDFSAENIRGSLLLEGFEGKDVEAVIKMTEDLSKLNKLIFGDYIPIVHVDEDKSGNCKISAYREPDKDDGSNEGYYIFMRGIVDNATSSMQSPKIWFDKEGKIKSGEIEAGGVAITLEEFMLGVAAHEVRHRVQQKPDFNKIDMVADMKKDYKDRESEKDARNIGYKAMKALHNGKSMEKIAEITGKLD